MDRPWLLLAGISGALAVVLGAFGAHGLSSSLADAVDATKRLGWWATGAQYHLVHSVALLGVAWLVERREGRAPKIAGVAFALGIVLFSGSLYLMTLTGQTGLGMITPIGGTAFIVGWGALAFCGLRRAN